MLSFLYSWISCKDLSLGLNIHDAPLCVHHNPADSFMSIRAISADIHGAVWLGSHDGTAKMVSVSVQHDQPSTIVLSELQALKPAAASIVFDMSGDSLAQLGC